MNVAIVPDDKDWTWVLQRECPECGFDASSLPPESEMSVSMARRAASPALVPRACTWPEASR